MPDPSASDRVAMLALLENPSGKGGIVKDSSKYKGYNVEIRPSRWGKKIWIGKLETRERAQYVADAVRHYLGLPPYFFEEGVMTLPTITCMGKVIGTSVRLSTPEMRVSYVRDIAKGEAFQSHRKDFKHKVISVVKNPDFPFLSRPRTEVGVLDDDDGYREDEFVFDEDAAKTLQMSSHTGGVPVAVVQTHVAGPDSVCSAEAVQAYVPGFVLDSNGSENLLRSTGQSINAIVFSIHDCPATSSEDEKIWIKSIEELDKLTAAETSTPSVAFNDEKVCRDGYETSPIMKIPPILRPGASTSSKIFGTPVERVVPAPAALGSSSDWPSSQCAINAKKQKIGD